MRTQTSQQRSKLATAYTKMHILKYHPAMKKHASYYALMNADVKNSEEPEHSAKTMTVLTHRLSLMLKVGSTLKSG